MESNLYGRSIGKATPHRFLPGGKGGLYHWRALWQCPQIILVEGLFDFATLWQAGFRNVTCVLGSRPNLRQFQQLCGYRGTVYLAFDADPNQSGQQASAELSQRVRAQGVNTLRVELPAGLDPNSFFVQGGDARQFRQLLEAARL